jgi:dTDP-6-deoxy-L-talose 4-dehydrogenase (NAD+)
MANIKGIENIHLYDEQEKKMKVLVTGSNGWIGKYVVEELSKQDDIEILNYKTDELPNAIIHLAWADLDYYDSPNHLLTAHHWYLYLKKYIDQGVRNITVTGTCYEYGNKEGGLYESMIPNPVTIYGVAKDALRRMLSPLDCDLKWLRLFYLYGKGQRSKSLVPKFMEALEKGDKEFLFRGGYKVRDYMQVEEVAKAIVKCALQKEITGVINVSSARPITLERFLSDIAKENGKEIEVRSLFSNDKEPVSNSFYGLNDKLKRIMYEL